MTPSTSSRPVGPLVTLAIPALQPSRNTTLRGRTVLLEPLTESHANDLFAIVGGTDPIHAPLWDYMGDGPYGTFDEFQVAIAAKARSEDPFFYAVSKTSSTPETEAKKELVGYLALMRFATSDLCVEIGNILFSPALQRTTAATEAVYLAARYAFEDLGYRRLEWKCNALNEPSKRAAMRFGFRYEGLFRQHMIVKGRSRDTAWFAILKDEWEGEKGCKQAMEKWLDRGNFDENGLQKKKLEEFRAW